MIHNIKDLDHINKYGIPESSKLELVDKIDLIVVPGVVFDVTGNRIGYGKGYYDRSLRKYKDVYKIGLAFDFQMVNSVPVDDWDEKVDKII